MKKRLISLVIIAVTLLSFLPVTANAATPSFSDVKPNNWFYGSVSFVAEKGLMAGTSGGKFSPTTSMTRAMVVTIFWNLEGSPYAYTNELTDVPKNKWFSTPIYWAFRSSVVSGYGNGKFGTNDLVTREQLVTMFKNYAEYKDLSTEKRTALNFNDAAQVSGWAKEAVTWAVAEGLISGVGNGKLNPKGTASRAEAAAMMMNFYNNILTAEPEVPETPETPEDPETPDIPDIPDIPETPTVPDNVNKYNYNENLLANNTVVNEHTFPSFDVDSTGFVKAGTKLTDLKGKTLKLYTPDSTPSFSYKTGGTKTDEWAWFLALKSELGLNVKTTVASGASSVELPLRDMHAGLQCDIIYTNGSNYPNALALSRNIDDLIDTNGLKKSVGLCTKTMDMLKWGNTYRAISPIGVVDVLWYNANASDVENLDDPHMLWKFGEWDWQAFDEFLRNAPKTYKGNTLKAFSHRAQSLVNIAPATAGTCAFKIDTAAKTPTVLNNWDNPTVDEAWTSLISTLKAVNPEIAVSKAEAVTAYNNFQNGKVLMSGTIQPMLSGSSADPINWVPYPSKNGGNGIAQTLAYTMLLPRKTVKESNVNIALKFAELWASRFTEAYFDSLAGAPYYNNAERKKEYFDFVTQNTVFALPLNELYNMSPDPTNFIKCFTGKSSASVTTQANNLSNGIMWYILDSLKYGQ